MANETLSARLYGLQTGDYQLVNSWARARGLPTMQEQLLPPVGVLVEHDGVPIVALWIEEVFGIGKCILDNAVSKPGLSVALARAAFQLAVDGCIKIAKGHAAAHGSDYSYFRCFTSGGVGRVLEGMGFHKVTENLTEYAMHRD